ncbi:MAG: TetR/AcrR family transcriptional regulator [Verrucomicrobiales bacterium]|nr:TetR/AcrR family transcriptional regulator [Verrucomicrobiales bacterium]
MSRKGDAKKRILEAAGKLFFELGYSGVGVNQIIQEADTAKATFYQHYPSKEILCVAWLDAMHERSELARAEILKSTEEPEVKIDQYFVELENFLEGSHFRGCPFTNTSSVTGEGCESIHKKIEAHKISIRDFFCDLAKQMTNRDVRARELGDDFFLLYSGATMEAQNLRANWPVQAARRAAAERCQQEVTRSKEG